MQPSKSTGHYEKSSELPRKQISVLHLEWKQDESQYFSESFSDALIYTSTEKKGNCMKNYIKKKEQKKQKSFQETHLERLVGIKK